MIANPPFSQNYTRSGMQFAERFHTFVVHELAHLIYPNHSTKFWNEVDKLLPDFSDRKEWLRVNGAGMDL